MPGYHIDRITEDIKREIVAILRELKDPRISGMLTVVKVSVTNDLSYAKVYVSAMEGLEAAKASVKGLTAAQGYIRHELGRRLHLRKCPELRFIADDSIEKGFALWGHESDRSSVIDSRTRGPRPTECVPIEYPVGQGPCALPPESATLVGPRPYRPSQSPSVTALPKGEPSP